MEGFAVGADDNTLSVHIRRLREKLEDNPSEPQYIITVRGFGYKWNKGSNK
jgi:two-component system, OmpR family, response regulator RegX3